MVVGDYTNKFLQMLDSGWCWKVPNCLTFEGKSVGADGGDLLSKEFLSRGAEKAIVGTLSQTIVCTCLKFLVAVLEETRISSTSSTCCKARLLGEEGLQASIVTTRSSVMSGFLTRYKDITHEFEAFWYRNMCSNLAKAYLTAWSFFGHTSELGVHWRLQSK